MVELVGREQDGVHAAKVINGLQQFNLQGETKKSMIYQSGEKMKGEYNQDSQNDEGSVKN